MALAPRSKKLWLPLAGGLFAISHALPAIVNDSETVWLGARAAAVAVFFPFIWAAFPPLGFLLGMYYPLLGFTLFGVFRARAFATGAAIALVSTMALWGICTPAEPGGNVISYPGGHLGWGFWLWLTSGGCLLMASFENGKARRFEQDEAAVRRRLGRWTVGGLAYAGVVTTSALVLTAIRLDASRHPTDAERREVEAEKRRMTREAEPAP